MREPFCIIDVPVNLTAFDEPMGTKKKFWFADEAEQSWLFKYARPRTGEHWAEKIASEIGSLLEVPCAKVDLATCGGEPGCRVLSFVQGAGPVALVHGNELLQEIDATYPVTQIRGVSKHTVAAVLSVLASNGPPLAASPTRQLSDGAAWFVGYLLLDALIGNCDRHHENWAVLQSFGAAGQRTLAPSYDHASSLGRELRDEERGRRLRGSDRRHTVASYVARARSALFEDAASATALSPVAAFVTAAAMRPDAGNIWLARLEQVGQNEIEDIVYAVPSSMMSDICRRFAIAMMRLTRHSLLERTR